jgi:predicted ATP-binding protein involved in virulence
VEDHQLSAVRQAISAFLPDFSNISVKRNPLRMEVEKNHVKYQIGQLSDGEKCIFAMIGDLARRLAITNPNSNNPLLGNGIVLIDEIDLHLHPAWQRMVVPNLIKTFPNCQFIVSTHSPQIFGEVDAQSVRRLGVDPIHGLVASIPRQAFGLDSSEILDEEMEAKSRNQETANQLQEIFRLIDKEQFSDAKKQMMLLRKKLMGNIPELVRAESLIAMLEPEKEEHQ